MTKYACMLLMSCAGLLYTSCETTPQLDSPASDERGGVSATGKPEGYVALPGKAATSSTPSETTTAFEFAAAAYANGAAPQVTEQPAQTTPTGAAPTPPVAQQPPAVLDPPPLNVDEALTTKPPVAPQMPQHTATALNVAPNTAAAATSDPSSYAVQMTNGTSGRLYIEMQDDSGNIFPFGFMYAGQRMGTRPQDARPIQGNLTVIIRDPDLPGAPEIRRYQVTPPAQYAGKTLGITILPGRYRVSVDGQVYYTSPTPEETAAAAMPQ